MRCYLVVLSLLAVFVAACWGQAYVENKEMINCFQHMECGKNEVYRCCGMCFERNCLDQSSNKKCSAHCYKGCYCATGYTRKAEGKQCVLDERCKALSG